MCKETNPKDALGTNKIAMHTVPPRVLLEIALAMTEGGRKYGTYNYRKAGVRASIYYDAAMRHLMAWWEGEDVDPDSGLSHIIKGIASLVVLRDSMCSGNWADDRPIRLPDGANISEYNKMAADLVERYPECKEPFLELSKKPEKPAAIVTFSGGAFDFINPDLESINILDISKALSHQCRYTGHTREFYSVGQHSVLASWWARDDGCSVLERLAVLLHDAAEAFLNDIASPAKQLLPDYLKLEQKLKNIIDFKFLKIASYPEGARPSISYLEDVIKKYDLKMRALEIRNLMPESPVFDPWLKGDAVLQPHEIDKFSGLCCFAPTWSFDEANEYFIAEFQFLMRQIADKDG